MPILIAQNIQCGEYYITYQPNFSNYEIYAIIWKRHPYGDNFDKPVYKFTTN